MDLAERLADAKARSVKLYLRRQSLEEQKQQLQTHGQQLMNQARATDVELLKVDGEIDVLELLVKDAHV
jgi:hypothetical protein